MRGLTVLSLWCLMIRQLSGFAVVVKRSSLQQHRAGRASSLTRNKMVSSAASDGAESSSTSSTYKTMRVLALHGSEGNGLEFSVKLYPIRDKLLLNKQVDLQILALSAPFLKGRGYAWWTMPSGVRSFNAEEYIGIDESTDIVLEAFSPPNTPPDLVVAHSQGAILMAALLAQNIVPQHPRIGYILNGVAWPNPYGDQLVKLQTTTTKADNADPPRALFVMGQEDFINPIESAKQVQDCLEKGGFQVAVHAHAGGHSVPDDEASIQAISDWIVEAEG